jgi:hypothetical protein
VSAYKDDFLRNGVPRLLGDDVANRLAAALERFVRGPIAELNERVFDVVRGGLQRRVVPQVAFTDAAGEHLDMAREAVTDDGFLGSERRQRSGVSGGVKMYQNRRFKNAGIKKGVILRAEMTPRFSQDSI